MCHSGALTTKFNKHPTFPLFLPLSNKSFSNLPKNNSIFFSPTDHLIHHFWFWIPCFLHLTRTSQTSNQQRHSRRTLPCSSAAPTLLPQCTNFLALARRSCTTSMFSCSRDPSLPVFHQRRRVLCESLEIENVLAKRKVKRTFIRHVEVVHWVCQSSVFRTRRSIINLITVALHGTPTTRLFAPSSKSSVRLRKQYDLLHFTIFKLSLMIVT